MIDYIFGKLPRLFNTLVRKLDLWHSTIRDPQIGHAPGIHFIAAGVILVILFGPSLAWLVDIVHVAIDPLDYPVLALGAQIILAASVIWILSIVQKFAITWLCKKGVCVNGNQLLYFHGTIIGLLVVLAGALSWFLLSNSGDQYYFQLYALLILLLMLVVCLVSNRVFHHTFESFIHHESKKSGLNIDHLARAKLMIDVDDIPSTRAAHKWFTLIGAPMRHPLLLLFLPALGVLIFVYFSPNLIYARVVGGSALVLSWLLMAGGSYYRNWDLQVEIFRRWFMLGGPMILSIIIMVHPVIGYLRRTDSLT